MKQQIPTHRSYIGIIGLYYDKGSLLPVIIVSEAKDSLIALRADRSRIRINPSRLVLTSQQHFEPTLENLEAFIRQVKKSDLPSVSIPSSGMDFPQLQSYLNIISDAQSFALYNLLKEHPETYYQKHELFFERSESGKQEYLEAQSAKNQRRIYLSQVQSYINDPQSEPDPKYRKTLILELRQLLQGEKIDDLHKVLVLLDKDPTIAAASLRERLGDAARYHDPALLASGLPISFCEELRTVVKDPHMLPAAEHTAFSIDDEDSLDFDDAISIEELADGYRLGIHVSNLAFHLDSEDGLFDLARDRVSSMYLPSGVVPMLPKKFSEGTFSLIQGQTRAVLSLYLEFDEALKIRSSKILPQRLIIEENLSYHMVDRSMDEPKFRLLHRMAEVLGEQRDPESRPDERRYIYNLKKKENFVRLQRIDLMSPSRLMIEELMICYNRNIALYAQAADLPMLFRNIKRFAVSDNDAPTSTAYLDTEARYHPGIGTEAYLHATSPIRRVVDLVNQMQIHAQLCQDNATFPPECLAEMINPIEKKIQLIRATVQKSERYWLLRLIESEYLHTELEGMLKASSDGKYRVELHPWGKNVMLKLDARPQNESFRFVAYAVNWDKMLLLADLID